MHIPKNLLLQWHITERCNSRCTHCYQNSFQGDELSFKSLTNILDQYDELMSLWNNKVRAHITIAGGEPFIREDIFELLEEIKKRERYTFAILTNGTCIDKDMIKRLKRLQLGFIQVSLEGKEKTHDSIRGDGSYKAVSNTIKCLVRNRIPTIISFTAHRGNYLEFPHVAKLGKKLGVRRVWADRLIPMGNGVAMKNLLLDREETTVFFKSMKLERLKALLDPFTRTEIAMHRALQFLHGGSKAYQCHAGDSLVTVGARGEVYPCRRMPIEAGNLMETHLSSIYYKSPDFLSLRDKSITSQGCELCPHEKSCRGGLKCLSYAAEGSPFKADPGCSIAYA